MNQHANQVADGLPERLRRERERLGLSQEKFAQMVGISRVTENYYEQGSREPPIAYLSAAARVGCDLRFLLFGESAEANYLDLMDWELHDRVWDWVDRVAVDAKGLAYPAKLRKRFFRLAYQACRGGRYTDPSKIDLTVLLAEAA